MDIDFSSPYGPSAKVKKMFNIWLRFDKLKTMLQAALSGDTIYASTHVGLHKKFTVAVFQFY